MPLCGAGVGSEHCTRVCPGHADVGSELGCPDPPPRSSPGRKPPQVDTRRGETRWALKPRLRKDLAAPEVTLQSRGLALCGSAQSRAR